MSVLEFFEAADLPPQCAVAALLSGVAAETAKVIEFHRSALRLEESARNAPGAGSATDAAAQAARCARGVIECRNVQQAQLEAARAIQNKARGHALAQTIAKLIFAMERAIEASSGVAAGVASSATLAGRHASAKLEAAQLQAFPS